MIMNEKEINGLTEILCTTRPDDVMSIMETTTKHMIKAESPEEAIKIILSYTDKASTLLRRRKVKKTAIFEYLRKHGILVPVDGEKTDYIKACLNYWQSPDKNDNASTFSAEVAEDSEDRERVASPQQSSATCASSTLVPQLNLTSSDIEQLGVQFSGWFFNGLNTLQDFGPHHFWPDSKMWLNLKVHGNKEEEFCIMGAESVATYLSKYIANEKIFFKPNVSNEAVRSTQEQHGLVKVSVSGIIHQASKCVGLFDAAFGLVNDPSSNYNWKVHTVYMAVQTQSSTPQPNGVPAHLPPYLCQ